MASKKKVRIDRVIILSLVVVLVLGAFGFGLYKLFSHIFDDSNEPSPIVPPIVTTDDVTVTLNNYTNYIDDTKELGFNFIIAELEFSADKPVQFELKNLQTSEKISLDNIQSYLNKLELAGYDLNKLQINVTGPSSTENIFKGNFFIPYTTDSSSLSVYNSKNAKRIEFNLSNKIPATSLKINDKPEDGQVIEVDGANITVMDSYVSSTLYHNDEECILGSTQKIFTFRISGENVGENVKIVRAQVLRNGESQAFDCLNEDYSTEKDDNALNKILVNGDNGALFFEIRTNEIKPDFSGVLLITFSNSDKVYEVPTSHE